MSDIKDFAKLMKPSRKHVSTGIPKRRSIALERHHTFTCSCGLSGQVTTGFIVRHMSDNADHVLLKRELVIEE